MDAKRRKYFLFLEKKIVDRRLVKNHNFLKMALRKYVFDDYYEEEVWEKTPSLRWKATKMVMQEPEHMQMWRIIFRSGLFPSELRIKIFMWMFPMIRIAMSAPLIAVTRPLMDNLITFRGAICLLYRHDIYFPFCRGFCFKCGEKAFNINGASRNGKRVLVMMQYCYTCTRAGFRHKEEPWTENFPKRVKCLLRFEDGDDLTGLLASLK